MANIFNGGCSVCHRAMNKEDVDSLNRCPDCKDLEPGFYESTDSKLLEPAFFKMPVGAQLKELKELEQSIKSESPLSGK